MNISKIVAATVEDSEELLCLYESVKGADMCNWREDYPSKETIAFDLKRDALFVMKDDDNKIIGAISLDEDEDVDGLSCWSKEVTPVGELSRLVVKSEYQNQGLARQLMQFGIDELKKRGFRGVHILVYKNNKKAQKAYSKFGYNMVGECHLFGFEYFCYELFF